MEARGEGRRGRRWWLWGILALVIGVLALVAVIAIPILTHENAGVSRQQPSGQWQSTATAVGDDGRTRTIELRTAEGGDIDPEAIAVGDRIVVHGSGFDAEHGIYVAVCVIPPSPADKPGPCVGGAPQESQDPEAHVGTIQWAVSNWINDDWAWRLFGARSYDDRAAGTFTAYLEIADPGEVDCVAEQCGIVTRSDHTAAADRVQDVYLPIRFAD